MHHAHGIRSRVVNLIERTRRILAARVSPVHIAKRIIEAIRAEARPIRTKHIAARHPDIRATLGQASKATLGRDLALPVEPLPADNSDQHRHIAMPINARVRRNAHRGVAYRTVAVGR